MNIKKFFATILSVALMFCLCACGGNDAAKPNESKTEENKTHVPKFNVTVTDTDGNAVEGVILQLRKNTVITARTNKKGVATFSIYITNGYKLSIVQCPDGYAYNSEESINVAPGILNLSIQITKK